MRPRCQEQKQLRTGKAEQKTQSRVGEPWGAGGWLREVCLKYGVTF
jgi:hypothetical protein